MAPRDIIEEGLRRLRHAPTAGAQVGRQPRPLIDAHRSSMQPCPGRYPIVIFLPCCCKGLSRSSIGRARASDRKKEEPITPRPRVAILILVLGAAAGGTAAAQQVPTLPMAPKELQDRPTNIILRLAKDGTPAINDQRVEWARLGMELQAIFGRRPEKILFMTTSPEDDVKDVRRVVAIAQKQGVHVFALPRNASSD